MQVKIPGDKSLSHRRVLFELLLEKPQPSFLKAKNLLLSEDVKASVDCVQTILSSHSSKNQIPLLDCKNSGTTARLLLGILAGNQKTYQLTGDESLCSRPMARVLDYLIEMGCQVTYLNRDGFFPLLFTGVGKIETQTFNFNLLVASAQIKSALLLAGVTTGSQITLTGKIQSRDHTERILIDGGVELEITERIVLKSNQDFQARGLSNIIASDPSSAAFWTLYAILNKQEIGFENLCLSKSRIGFYQILKDSGVNLTWDSSVDIGKLELAFSGSNLKDQNQHSICTQESQAAFCIDEILLLAIMSCFFVGEHKFFGARELRVKESNRLRAIQIIVEALGSKFIADCEDGDDNESSDSFSIVTKQRATSLGDIKDLNASKDHRVIMSLAILEKVFNIKSLDILYPEAVEVSYPEFWKTLNDLEVR